MRYLFFFLLWVVNADWWSKSLEIISNTDKSAPSCALVTLSSTSITVGTTDVGFSASARLTDEGRGFQSGEIVFTGLGKTLSCTNWNLVSGTRTSGTFTCSLVVKTGYLSGSYSLSYFNMWDFNGNMRRYSLGDGRNMMWNTTIQVTSTNEDRSAPTLEFFNLTLTELLTRNGQKTTTVNVSATDVGTGITSARVVFTSPIGTTRTITLNRGAGTLFAGSASWNYLDVPGTWQISVVLRDVAENVATYSGGALSGRGWPSSIWVDAVGDVTTISPTKRESNAPTCSDIQLGPSRVNVTEAPGNLWAAVTCADDLSGVGWITVWLQNGDGTRFSVLIDTSRLISGTYLDGVFNGSLQVQPGVSNGAYTTTSVVVVDQDGNRRVYGIGVTLRSNPVVLLMCFALFALFR